MKPETINLILDLLKSQEIELSDEVLRVARLYGSSAGSTVFDKYKKLYEALSDFEEWVDEQED